MESQDRKKWTEFRSHTSSKLRKGEFELICELHAKYYNHSYYKPCTCSPRTINKWIKQLNDVYEQEV